VVDNPKSLNVLEAVPPASFERNIVTVAKGGGIMFVGKLFLSVSRFVTAILLARFLGAEEYGVYSLAISAGGLAAGLAMLGLDSAVVRYVAIAARRRDEAGLWGALQVSLGLSALLSVLVSAGLYAAAYPLAASVFHEPRLAPLLQLTALIVPSLTLGDVLAGANRGFKKMEYPVIAQFIVQPAIRFVLIVVLAFFGLSAAWAVAVFGAADFAATVMMLYFLHKQFSLRRPLRAARRDTGAILGFSLPDWLSGLLVTFRSHVQSLLLGTLNTMTSVGVFAVASQVHTITGLFYSSINTSARPFLAELHDQGDHTQMGRIYQTATKWSLTMYLPVFLVVVLFPAPLLSIFGESFVAGAVALTILAWVELVNVGTGMGGVILEMTGYTKLKLVNAVVRLALYLGLNLLLIPRHGVVGAALAALVAEGVINLLRLVEVFILFRLLPYHRSLLKPATAGLAALAVTWTIGQWFPAGSNLLRVAAQALLLFAVYVGATLSFGLSPEDRLLLARLGRRAGVMLTRR